MPQDDRRTCDFSMQPRSEQALYSMRVRHCEELADLNLNYYALQKYLPPPTVTVRRSRFACAQVQFLETSIPGPLKRSFGATPHRTPLATPRSPTGTAPPLEKELHAVPRIEVADLAAGSQSPPFHCSV